MGREIRKVTKNWQHPKDKQGKYIPLYDKTYEELYQVWLANSEAWDNDTHPCLIKEPYLKQDCPTYEDWNGVAPYKEWCRPAHTGSVNCYQVYNTNAWGLGTPVSPVFETKTEMKAWLKDLGHTHKEASEWIRTRLEEQRSTDTDKVYHGYARLG